MAVVNAKHSPRYQCVRLRQREPKAEVERL
jgi:hypothetical protein